MNSNTSEKMAVLLCQNCKSAVTHYAITFNHVMDWDHAKVLDREATECTDGSKQQQTSGKYKKN